MDFANLNGSCDRLEEQENSSNENVAAMVEKIGKQLIQELQDQMRVVFTQLLQKTMDHLNTGMINLSFKVDNMETKVETTIVGVLKGVFGLREMPNSISQAERQAK